MKKLTKKQKNNIGKILFYLSMISVILIFFVQMFPVETIDNIFGDAEKAENIILVLFMISGGGFMIWSSVFGDSLTFLIESDFKSAMKYDFNYTYQEYKEYLNKRTKEKNYKIKDTYKLSAEEEVVFYERKVDDKTLRVIELINLSCLSSAKDTATNKIQKDYIKEYIDSKNKMKLKIELIIIICVNKVNDNFKGFVVSGAYDYGGVVQFPVGISLPDKKMYMIKQSQTFGGIEEAEYNEILSQELLDIMELERKKRKKFSFKFWEKEK